LKYHEKTIKEVLLLEPDIYEDDRGFFMETYHHTKYSNIGIDSAFVQDNRSRSKKGVLRGLHYQLKNPQAKLVYVITGKILDVAVDIRQGSPTFGKWSGDILSYENRHQLYIPEGFAHGFCVLSDIADVMYKCTDFYDPDDEYGIFWSDPDINIDWPLENSFLSPKDAGNPKLADIPESNLPTHKIK
jgi:dTDP-4-dehydrorhamnose 3,5-epimerase